MRNRQDNEILNQVGPGTPMGDLLRQYWVPVLMSEELPEPDGKPRRVRLLGEDLVAFRDTSGRVGLLGEFCSHRGSSLYFGRNEGNGLRCIYHGWKYDGSGACVDMPNEPAESNFKDKVKHPAYPCEERGGIVFAYMGPRAEAPPLPAFELLSVPESYRVVNKAQRRAGFIQSMDGDLDSAHLFFLHAPAPGDEKPADDDGEGGYQRDDERRLFHPDRAPRIEIVDTDYGLIYAARRRQGADRYYYRISHFVFPFYTLFPPIGFPAVPFRAWVPIDDEHTMVWTMAWSVDAPMTESQRAPFVTYHGGYLPHTSDPMTHWKLAAGMGNDFFRDYEVQRHKTFSGIPGVALQDWAVTESPGPLYDRTKERLGTTDAALIRARRQLLRAAKALRDDGVTPPAVDDASLYGVRSASVVLPQDVGDWVEATQDDRRAFTGRPIAAA